MAHAPRSDTTLADSLDTPQLPPAAVMALMPELDMDDLVYVKREIEQRLGMGPDMADGGGGNGGSGRRHTPQRQLMGNGCGGTNQ